MKIRVIDRQPHSKGEILTIQVRKKTVKILFLFHAIRRINKWHIQEEMVVETLILPEEVVVGHRNRYIAHRRYGNHLVRAIYEYEQEIPVLLTVYFPYVNRYFQGSGIYEDKILEGS